MAQCGAPQNCRYCRLGSTTRQQSRSQIYYAVLADWRNVYAHTFGPQLNERSPVPASTQAVNSYRTSQLLWSSYELHLLKLLVAQRRGPARNLKGFAVSTAVLWIGFVVVGLMPVNANRLSRL